jgi:hypothetical protein
MIFHEPLELRSKARLGNTQKNPQQHTLYPPELFIKRL